MIESNSPGNFKRLFEFEEVEPSRVVGQFEESRRQCLDSLAQFESRRKAQYASHKSLCDNLTSVLETVLGNSDKRLYQLYRFFDQFRLSLRRDFPELQDLSIFKFQRSKKAKFAKRTVAENADLFDLVSNFKEEFIEMAESHEKSQRFVNEQLASLVKDQLKPLKDKVLAQLALARANRGRLERANEEAEKAFKETSALLAFNVGNSLFGGRRQGAQGREEVPKSKRNSFEEVSRFFVKAQQCFDAFRAYAGSTLELFEGLREFERRGTANIKSSFLLFVERVGQVHGQAGQFFPTTRYLADTLDPDLVTAFEFDVSAFLLPQESQLVLQAASAPQGPVDFELLRRALTGVSMPDPHATLNRLIADKFFCLVLEEGASPAQATVFATTENTLVFYKVNTLKKELEFLHSWPAECCGVERQPGLSTFQVSFKEKGLVWSKKRSATVACDELTFKQVEAFLGLSRSLLAFA